MTTHHSPYEIIVGLEVHAQLLTKSKLFSTDSTEFGREPNTNVSIVTLAHPGTLPKMNRRAIEFAIKIGLALHCDIEKKNYFARKNYFYPDLPKGYQVSQHTTPICRNGYVNIRTNEGEKRIRLNRIHLEEDAGKSLHDVYANCSVVDFNRAGIPLIEIVSEPDLRGGEDAYAYLTELRKLVRYLQICDGNMEEGSLRCDANVSVRKKGETKLGTRIEVKNLNSIRNVKRAIEFEGNRLIGILESGGTIQQETRSFDTSSGSTFAIREKEEADDYRYFPEPDLTPFALTDSFIEHVRSSIPPLQDARVKKYREQFGLSEYDARLLTEEREFADYFEKICETQSNPKSAANWMIGPVRSWLNENNKEIGEFGVKPQRIGTLIQLVETGKLSFSAASSKIFPLLVQDPNKDPMSIATELNLLQVSEAGTIEPIVIEVLEKLSDKVKEYRKGKKGLLSLFVGEVMKRSGGKADPKLVNEIILEKLNHK